jgi:hypothetical protein
MAERLLLVAERSLGDDSGLASRRRAVSTAYYSVFHALARLCADEFLGIDGDIHQSDDYERVYRALEHRSMKAVFGGKSDDNPAVAKIGDAVVELQSSRHDADYRPPTFAFSDIESTKLLLAARSILQALDRLSPEERRRLAVRLIIKNRT